MQPERGDRAVVLAVGGLDPSGGAGLMVDAAVLRSLGVHALAVCTGVAVQSGGAFVERIDTGAAHLEAQLDAVTRAFPVQVVKSGMLGTVEQVQVLLRWLDAHPEIPWVVDPVLASTSGGVLLDPSAVEALRAALPRATVITPNLHEAAVLTGSEVETETDLHAAALRLLAAGASWAWMKGGHLRETPGVDLLVGLEATHRLVPPERALRAARGTGCAAASALAAGLAQGLSVPQAVLAAKHHVTDALTRAYPAGDARFLALFPDP